MLTRPVTENRAQRALGGGDIPATMIEGMTAAFGADTIGTLLQRQGEIIAAENRAAPNDRRRARTGRGDVTPPRVDRTPADVLNQRYKDYGVTFDTPMTDEAARIIAEARRDQNIRNDALSRAPGGLANAAYFGAGLAGMATDPLEVATAFIPLVGPTRLAALTARFGTVGGRVAAGVVEGALGNALVEPIYYGLSRQQRLDYTMADALLNIGLGGALGGVLGFGGGVLARRREAAAQTVLARDVDGIRAAINPEAQATQALRASVSQMALGRAVEVEPPRAPVLEVNRIRVKGGTLESVVSPLRFPVLNWLKAAGGVDPAGELAGELRAAGVTNRTLPGLFRKGGRRSADNLSLDPADDWLTEGTIRLQPDADGGATYVDPQSIVDGVRRELSGDPIRRPEAEARYQKLLAENRAMSEVGDAADALGIALSERERDIIAADMLETGGSAEDAIERWAVRNPPGGAKAEGTGAIPFFDDDTASARVDEFIAGRESDTLMDEDEALLIGLVDEYRRRGEITPDMEAAIVEADAMMAKANAAADVSRAYAACLSS